MLICLVECKTELGKLCVFPFEYKPEHEKQVKLYYACTDVDDIDMWCATEYGEYGHYDYDYCTEGC